MTMMKRLAVGAVAAMGAAGLATLGVVEAGPATTVEIQATDWAAPGCVPVSVVKYSDGSVWGIENCGGLERRVLLGYA